MQPGTTMKGDSRFHNILLGITSRLVQSHSEDFKVDLEESLKDIGEFYDVDRTGFLWFDKTKPVAEVVATWTRQDTFETPLPQRVTNLTALGKSVLAGQVRRLSSRDDLPRAFAPTPRPCTIDA